ncbi:hypothetical protein OXE08_004530 [Salmonella enterica]|nr:hypothetical protein [Salmonella enterica]
MSNNSNGPSDNDEKRLQAMIPRELHQRFKLAAYADGKQINSVLIEMITDYLNRRDKSIG